MRLNIIIPLYNEAGRIKQTLENLLLYMASNDAGVEIAAYLVNDGSTDNSAEIIANIIKQNPKIKLLSYETNRGKGYAFKYGVLNSAQADYYYLSDADGSADWKLVTEFLSLARQEGYDCVIASRVLPGAQVQRDSSKRFSSFVSSLLIRSVLNIPFQDTQCGYKLFSTKCYPFISELKLERFGFDFELLKRLHDAKLKIKEVPITWEDKKGSKVKISDYFKTFSELLRVRFN